MDKSLIFLIVFLVVLVGGAIGLMYAVGTMCASVYTLGMIVLGIITETDVKNSDKSQ